MTPKRRGSGCPGVERVPGTPLARAHVRPFKRVVDGDIEIGTRTVERAPILCHLRAHRSRYLVESSRRLER